MEAIAVTPEQLKKVADKSQKVAEYFAYISGGIDEVNLFTALFGAGKCEVMVWTAAAFFLASC